ncbi:MAG: arsenic efflux protein [Clostridia bacterium]|nr:arsenic efflux protein [Clostridia bacterium]
MDFQEFLHLLLHSLLDTLTLLPFLFITYLLIEIIQRKADFNGKNKFLSGNASPFFGALLGVFPQCGFSVMSAKLYENNLIKAGTLLAVFIATSDEAFALLLTSGKFLPLVVLLGLKFLLALLVGFTVNAFFKKSVSIKYKGAYFVKHEDYCRWCGSSSKNTNTISALLLYPLLHALKTFAFVYIVNLVFGVVIHFIGEENILQFMKSALYVQPLVCSLVGLIPNCASSILITQLYIKGGITFGSAFAGLSANAGIGLAVMLKNRKNIKNNLIILLILYLVSVISGFIINLLINI